MSYVLRSLTSILFILRAWGSIEDFEGVELDGQIYGMLQAEKRDVRIRKTMESLLSYQFIEPSGQREEKGPESMEGSSMWASWMADLNQDRGLSQDQEQV